MSSADGTAAAPAHTGPHSRHVFSDYSPEWPAAFRREAEVLRAALGVNVVEIHHIGSTSVRGLAAKATIDILPLVRSLDEVDASNARIRGAEARRLRAATRRHARLQR